MRSLPLTNGAKMPILGLGTWQSTNEAEVIDALNVALELGYRHIDTAMAYENEHIIGKVVKQWIDSGKLKREDLFIVTKLPVTAVHEDKVEEMLTTSLKSLGLPYVDLYLIHFPVCSGVDDKGWPTGSIKTDHVKIWKKMEEQVNAGRTKAIGLSNFNAKQIDKLLKSNPKIKPANLQVELHVYLQQPELVKFCQGNGITVTAYSPFCSPGYNNFMDKIGQKRKVLPNIWKDDTIAQIAKKHKKSIAQVCLKFLEQKDIIVIPKSVNPQRLKENFEIFDFTLDSTDMKTLEGLDTGEHGRTGRWDLFPGLDDNDEWPFPKLTA